MGRDMENGLAWVYVFVCDGLLWYVSGKSTPAVESGEDLFVGGWPCLRQ